LYPFVSDTKCICIHLYPRVEHCSTLDTCIHLYPLVSPGARVISNRLTSLPCCWPAACPSFEQRWPAYSAFFRGAFWAYEKMAASES